MSLRSSPGARGAVAGVSAVLAGLSAAPAGAQTVIAAEHRPTGVTALDDVAVWSSYDPASDRFRLVAATGDGEAKRLPVAARSVPFDADLGRTGDGRMVVAYSRCRTEPRRQRAEVPLPNYASGRGCRLYRYVLGQAAERRIRSLGRPSGAEFLPSIWRGRVVFVRKLRRGGRLAVVERSLRSGRERGVTLPRGPVAREAVESIPTVLDLAGRRLLTGWEYVETECRDPHSSLEQKIAPDGSEVYRGTVRKLRRIAAGCTNDPVRLVFAPSQLGRLSFSLDDVREGSERGFRWRTYSPSGAVLASRAGLTGGAFATSAARSGLYYVTSATGRPDGRPVAIVRTAL